MTIQETNKQALLACVFVLAWSFFPLKAHADVSPVVQQLKLKVEQQDQVIKQQQATIEQVLAKMAMLEAKVGARPSAKTVQPGRVDLSEQELEVMPMSGGGKNVLERPWFQNLRIDGFGGAGFVWTGGDALEEHGGFAHYEATINVDAEVWEDIHYFHEIQTIRAGDEDEQFIRTGEVYVNFKDLFNTFFGMENVGVGAKIGRVDIPFGEDYLTQDVVDNPLITYSAAFPYGFDEGLVLYGRVMGIGWVAALMDGADARAFEDDSEKFMSLKLYGNPTDDLYLSGSFFRNGRASKSAWEFGGSHFEPLGTDGISSLGPSLGTSVEVSSYELDAKYSFGFDRYLKLQYGGAFVHDAGDYDRNIHYFQVEPKWNFGSILDNKVYVISRFSAVGTFDSDEGYRFDGKPFAGGSASFGYDTKALYRLALGLGYQLNPHTLVKAEYSRDNPVVIDRSSLDDSGDRRNFFGVITALKFG